MEFLKWGRRKNELKPEVTEEAVKQMATEMIERLDPIDSQTIGLNSVVGVNENFAKAGMSVEAVMRILRNLFPGFEAYFPDLEKYLIDQTDFVPESSDDENLNIPTLRSLVVEYLKTKQ